MSNTIGKLFTFTSFGESHGKGIGGIVDGYPPGIELDETFIQQEQSPQTGTVIHCFTEKKR